MIDIQNIPILKLDDYDKIKNLIKKEYYHSRFISELKERVGDRCDLIMIEYPYYDKDYLSTVYSYYSKLFKKVEKECYRIHMFNKGEYYGYFTLRPTINSTKVGKSYINPKILLTEQAYLILGDFEMNLLGSKAEVSAYPWMYQETDISVCAHVAVWSIIRYYGNKYNNYSDKRMMNVVNTTPNGQGRNIPSKGLVITQIAEILRKNEFHPLIVGKTSSDKGEFLDEMISYIESGIPLVAAITKYGHAVSIIGHGKVNYSKLKSNIKNIVYNSELMDTIIINDDNFFPYLEVKKKGLAINKIQKYDLDDIDYIVVPLYDRMMLGYWTVRQRFESLINSASYTFNNENIARIYITSSNSLKYNIQLSTSMDSDLKNIISKLELPKFIWCIDIATADEYENGLISGKIIIDSTAGTYEDDPWLLIQDKEKIVYKDGNEYFRHQKNVDTYPIYKNNLREV